MRTQEEILEKIEKLTDVAELLQKVDKDSEAVALVGNVVLYLKWASGTLDEMESHAFGIVDGTLEFLVKAAKDANNIIKA